MGWGLGELDGRSMAVWGAGGVLGTHGGTRGLWKDTHPHTLVVTQVLHLKVAEVATSDTQVGTYHLGQAAQVLQLYP